MKCSKCGIDLFEREIQNSHDIPKYAGGTDKDGRHWLCKKCHDIYEKIAFSILFKEVPEEIQAKCRAKLKIFAKGYFNGNT